MSIGPLVSADETLNHQVVETFASVGQADLSWTERVWVNTAARDGSLQLVFGLGKYTNRGVLDGFAALARGQEQWTVRASRRLASDFDQTAVGPIRYEVVEPLRSIRAILEPSEHAPIAFDVVTDGLVPPMFEAPSVTRNASGSRRVTNILRFHQAGTASGWAEVEGERFELSNDRWVAFRDRSWGLRGNMGPPIPGLPDEPRDSSIVVLWSPMLLERPDGSHYSLFFMWWRRVTDGVVRTHAHGVEELPSGDQHVFVSVTPDLRIQDDNRRLLGAELHVVTAEGIERPIKVTPVSATGFHLGAGLYGGYQGHYQGEWRGELFVEGDLVIDCASPEVARQLHQLREPLVRVHDPVGGGAGYGLFPTLAMGAHPDLGLTAENSFH
jgi:hypothetical protein